MSSSKVPHSNVGVKVVREERGRSAARCSKSPQYKDQHRQVQLHKALLSTKPIKGVEVHEFRHPGLHNQLILEPPLSVCSIPSSPYPNLQFFDMSHE